MTSLHDAIAAAAASMDSTRPATKRRALVVLTDGFDNASKLEPAEVSRIASRIDLPVYMLARRAASRSARRAAAIGTAANAARQGNLADLARWTGGQLFSTSTPAQPSDGGAHASSSELRHQYLIAFEPGTARVAPGRSTRTRKNCTSSRRAVGYVAGPPARQVSSRQT